MRRRPRSKGVPALIRMTRASMLGRRLAGADGTVDSIAATRPRCAATLSRNVSIQVAKASRRLVTRRGEEENMADHSVQPTAPPMAAPTGHRVMSPRTAAPMSAAMAARRVAGSTLLVNDIFFPTGVVAKNPVTMRAMPVPTPVEASTMRMVIGRRWRSARRSRNRPGDLGDLVGYRSGKWPVRPPAVRRRSRSR